MDTLALHPRYQTPEYHWYRRALARDRLPVQDENPQSGCFRWGDKGVEIWNDPDLNQTCCVVDGQLYDMVLCRQNWVSISREVVAPWIYRQHIKTGKWPGESEVGAAVTKAVAAMGDNVPPAEGPELLVTQLDELERDAQRLIDAGPAKTQAEADEAAALADGIDKVEKKAGEIHRTAKAPHLEAGKVLDRLFFPIRDRAADLKKALKAVRITPFLLRDQVERSKATAELVAKGADPSNVTDKTSKAIGNTRTTALRTVKRAIVNDYMAVATHLIEHPDVKEAVLKVANASARAGVVLPGMSIATEQVAV